MATISPSPTVTSQAATTITISANTWPASPPHMRANATRARLAPFSISSRQRRMTRGSRRTSTPPAPMQKISAETTRYQPIATRSPPSWIDIGGAADGLGRGLERLLVGAGTDSRALGHRPHIAGLRGRDANLLGRLGLGRVLEAGAAAGEDDGAHRGHEEQDRRGLEGEEVRGQEQPPDVAGCPEAKDVGSPLVR